MGVSELVDNTRFLGLRNVAASLLAQSRGRAFLGVVLVGWLAGILVFGACAKGEQAAIGRHSPFDGVRAFKDLKTVVGFGPRTSGSKALQSLRGYITDELHKAGLETREHRFDASTPVGTVPMVNVVGVIHGTDPGIIIVGNHYETKLFSAITFVGANDGGSTTAWMIEMARALGPTRAGKTVWLCFFDGEEAFKEWSETDSLYGSRAFVKHLTETHELGQVCAMVNVDMIGDRYLTIKRDRDAPEWLTQAIWGTARDLGLTDYFLPFAESVTDDHIPFRRAGVPSIEIIDFCYGQTEADHARNWHTANDTLDKVSAASLQVVGDVIYHALLKIDARCGNASKG